MKIFLICAGLLLAGCASNKAVKAPPLAPGAPGLPPATTARERAATGLDSTVYAIMNAPRPEAPTALGKVWGAITGSGKVKDKSRTTVTNYYSAAKVKATGGSTAATGTGAEATTVSKPRGPVATAEGAVASDYTKQGQRGGAAASGAGAVATATTTKGGLPWWLYALGGLLLFGAGMYCGASFSPAGSVLAKLRRVA